MRLEVWPLNLLFDGAPHFLPPFSPLPLPLNEIVTVISKRTCVQNYPRPQAILALVLCELSWIKSDALLFRVRLFPGSPDRVPSGSCNRPESEV